MHLVLREKEAATAGVILREWGWLAFPPLPAPVGGRFRLGREETEYWESADRVVSGRQSDGLRTKSPGLQLLHRRRTSFPTDPENEGQGQNLGTREGAAAGSHLETRERAENSPAAPVQNTRRVLTEPPEGLLQRPLNPPPWGDPVRAWVARH